MFLLRESAHCCSCVVLVGFSKELTERWSFFKQLFVGYVLDGSIQTMFDFAHDAHWFER